MRKNPLAHDRSLRFKSTHPNPYPAFEKEIILAGSPHEPFVPSQAVDARPLAILIRVFLMCRSWRLEMSRSLPLSLSPYRVEEGRSRGCGSGWLVAVGIAIEPERFGLEY